MYKERKSWSQKVDWREGSERRENKRGREKGKEGKRL
jgi:hypothetical protein